MLGIEAARATLIREVMSTLDEQGLEVDVRHIFLVADLMTSKGYLQQIGRHGIAGTKTSVLARAAFEITVPTLAEAAIYGETEELKGRHRERHRRPAHTGRDGNRRPLHGLERGVA